MILDQLIEKKDLNTYILVRIRMLQKSKKDQLKLKDKQKIHSAIKQLDGRIAELRQLKKSIHSLKELSKEGWNK